MSSVLVSARASSGGGGDAILCDVLSVLTVHSRYPWSPGHLTTTTTTDTSSLRATTGTGTRSAVRGR